MSANDPRLLDLWDLSLPPLPPRSRLFALAPVGIGTPAVESLTGYVARLAAAHGVLVRRLVEGEILPLLGRSYLLSAEGMGRSSSFWQQSETRALNGTGTLARDLVQVLETLTLREDLRWLTLRPWAEVLPVKGLLRRQRAWCPACYQEWQQTGAVTYEPLLWTLAPVTCCLRHQRRLQHTCPHPACRRVLPLLGPRSRPGCCSACGRWLGSLLGDRVRDARALTDQELQAQQWVGEVLGDLLAQAPGLALAPARTRLAHVVDAYIAAIAGGNVQRFARALGLPMGTVAQWRWGKTLPSLALLLQVCYRLGTTPWCLFTDDLDRVPRVAAAQPRPAAATLLDAPRHSPPCRQAFDTSAMRRALEAVLACDDQPSPPMRHVAKRLGHHHAELIQHLPELCHAISARYLADRHRRTVEKQRRLCAEVRHAAMHLHQQEIFPSACRIARLLSQPGFIRDPLAIAARKELLHELGWQT
ncbi:MAG: TniQ family protein [Chloroflexota bacterium]